MNLFGSFAISASGLTAERVWLDTISNNLANLNTTRTTRGGPYKRQVPVFLERLQTEKDAGSNRFSIQKAGVEVSFIWEDQQPPRLIYDPTHPDANAQGYVAYPNINTVNEMIDLITASRAYEANITTLEAAKNMAQRALEIGR
ncbi:MAG: flagellar basal body rod protein FlgC [Peptococcaceae bacterium]